MAPATVVPELIRLVEDLSVIRDMGPLEARLVDWREFYESLWDEPGHPVKEWSDEQLIAQIVMRLADLQALVTFARRRGMLG